MRNGCLNYGVRPAWKLGDEEGNFIKSMARTADTETCIVQYLCKGFSSEVIAEWPV